MIRMRRMTGMLRETVTWGNLHLVHEGLKPLREAKITLDHPAGVLTLVHLVEAADPLVVFVSRVNKTLAIQVLSFVAVVTPITLASVRKEIEHAILTDKWGT